MAVNDDRKLVGPSVQRFFRLRSFGCCVAAGAPRVGRLGAPEAARIKAGMLVVCREHNTAALIKAIAAPPSYSRQPAIVRRCHGYPAPLNFCLAA